MKFSNFSHNFVVFVFIFSLFNNCRYVLFWLVIFTCKYIFAYFLQARAFSFLTFIGYFQLFYTTVLIIYVAWDLCTNYSAISKSHLLLQIRPLVKPTNIIMDLRVLEYSWHDLISKSKMIIYTTVTIINYMFNLVVWNI